MKILIANHLYHPVLGGSVVLTDAIADALRDAGHETRITTKTPGEDADSSPYRVQRTPGAAELADWIRWSDGVIIIEPSLSYCVAAWTCGRPAVVTLQTWYWAGSGLASLGSFSRRYISGFFAQITAPSEAVSASWGGGHAIVPNGFESRNFQDTNGHRDFDYVFIGRMISDKGPDLFLDALGALHEGGHDFKALVIGGGESLENCKELARRRGGGFNDKVEFYGEERDRTVVAALLNRCKVLVVPNRWDEPFGMVALEALACGCRLVVTRSGALPQVASGFASVVDKNSPSQLADAMIHEREQPKYDRMAVERHLLKFRWDVIVESYIFHLRSQ